MQVRPWLGVTAASLVATTSLVTGQVPLAVAAQRPADGPAPAAAAQQADVAEPPRFRARAVDAYDAFDANQGIGVDRRHFYAVDNSTITKHEREGGEAVRQFAGREGGPVEHLDSGVVVGGRLFAAHSNYPEWPMESSIEVFDTHSMRHVETHSFGIYRGSLTWLDRHDGAWWAAFANYDRVMEGETEPYGETYNTQVVKMDDDFQVVESWTIPKQILDKFDLMSNSGGSWGPDGRLWLTGHDLPEAYVMELPGAGSELVWVATVELPGIHGQGIAWDRSDRARSTLWGISRPDLQALRFTVPLRAITSPAARDWEVLGPGSFRP